MSHRASYLTHAEEARDQIDWNPEWSRRGRGVRRYSIATDARGGKDEGVTGARVRLLIILLLAGAFYLWGLGSVGFQDPD